MANINNDKEEEKDHNSFFKMPALRGTILYPPFLWALVNCKSNKFSLAAVLKLFIFVISSLLAHPKIKWKGKEKALESVGVAAGVSGRKDGENIYKNMKSRKDFKNFLASFSFPLF